MSVLFGLQLTLIGCLCFCYHHCRLLIKFLT